MNTEPSLTLTLALPPNGFTVAAPLPEMLSQLNVETTTGIPRAAFLRMLREPGFPLKVTVVPRSKLRLVDRASFVAWLKSGAALSSTERPDAANEVNVTASLARKLKVTVPPKARRG